ncbi:MULTISPECIES: DUF5995 family protein [Streptomyces]|uniref:DUF5995 family protein n=1 Tax=Streptomyces TaxID=1883 RepID=UPI0010397FA2|nr:MULTISPECIES: DUF5995 family protein [Streptomyces]MBT3078696.1 hypothetical protein [Streptomyces sp. COG21]MBT3080429.1 hypothetical protein [Streptomyces sp. COG20]MBT3098425.1 hypothetical protein [Streptomyces sp. CBG30]MBT3107725.1 hypothetical protein [Streptomyces sp. COG19]MBT3108560.1 hypothetical protein [Streptomyces sp. CYG20]
MTQTEQFTEPAVRSRPHRWPPGDGVGVFHDVRLAVARPEHRRGGSLEARLTERYLAALDAAEAGGQPPECWRPLFQYRHHPGVRPVQFALAGLHAHIAHDLTLAVVDTCRTRDCEPAALEGEFERVGDLLTLLEERIHDELLPDPDLLRIADPLTHLVSSWSLERAREAAWSAARVLRQLRGSPALAEEFRQRTDAGAGLVVRFLLTPAAGARTPMWLPAQSSGSSTGAISS